MIVVADEAAAGPQEDERASSRPSSTTSPTAVATITLNRPDSLNTIVPPMPDEVEAAVEARRRRPGGEGDRRARRRARVLRRL